MKIHERVLITGAEGLLGRYFTAHLLGHCSLATHSHASLDITDAKAVEAICERDRPDLIINCAVVGVDASERDSTRANAVNVTGPRNLAASGDAIGADLVHFSSNYVFAGDRLDEKPYTIADRPQPINQYGKSKLAGEIAVRELCARSFIIRSSWIFGQGKGGFVNETRRRLLVGEPMEAVTSVRANTTFATDLVLRALEVIRQGTYGTYHLVNTGVCSYYDIAIEMARRLRFPKAEAERLVGGSRESVTSWIAPRPSYTPMRCITSEELGFAQMRHWTDALAHYLHQDNATEY